MSFLGFIFGAFGVAIFPRVTLAVVLFTSSDNNWTTALAIWALISASEHGKTKAKEAAKFIVNLLNHAVTGKQLIIEREVEKIVEMPVEKIVERVRTVTKTIKVKDMSREEAYSALGCNSGASEARIKHGYHLMMQKVHPDHGGSTYLAAQVNQAKTMLLK